MLTSGCYYFCWIPSAIGVANHQSFLHVVHTRLTNDLHDLVFQVPNQEVLVGGSTSRRHFQNPKVTRQSRNSDDK